MYTCMYLVGDVVAARASRQEHDGVLSLGVPERVLDLLGRVPLRGRRAHLLQPVFSGFGCHWRGHPSFVQNDLHTYAEEMLSQIVRCETRARS